jgi:hypothetical protein
VDPAVTVGTLPNGLRYYIRVNHRPAKRAELRLVVNAGSVIEDPDQRGLAHFAEHMAFNGTTHFKKQELIDYIESIGMRFGADLNAGTSFDETVYELQVPTDSAHIVARSAGWCWRSGGWAAGPGSGCSTSSFRSFSAARSTPSGFRSEPRTASGPAAPTRWSGSTGTGTDPI